MGSAVTVSHCFLSQADSYANFYLNCYLRIQAPEFAGVFSIPSRYSERGPPAARDRPAILGLEGRVCSGSARCGERSLGPACRLGHVGHAGVEGAVLLFCDRVEREKVV
jgi:hypothetical protein